MNVKYSDKMIAEKLKPFRDAIHGYGTNTSIDKAHRLCEAGRLELEKLKPGTDLEARAKRELSAVIRRYWEIDRTNQERQARVARARAWDMAQGVTA